MILPFEHLLMPFDIVLIFGARKTDYNRRENTEDKVQLLMKAGNKKCPNSAHFTPKHLHFFN